jgi:CHASE2 domain-containing sensor protein
MFLLKLFIFNIHFLNPLSQSLKDFEMTDLIYSQLRKSEPNGSVQLSDTNIVLVNVGKLGRAGIAKQLNIINRYKPAVVAVDVTFEKLKGNAGDTLLANAFAKTKNLVLASYFDYSKPELNGAFDLMRTSHPFFSAGKQSAFVNFVSADPESTVRYVRPAEEFDGKKYNCFAAEIVKKFSAEASENFEKRDKEIEVINYSGRRDNFIVFDADEINDTNSNLAVISGKIVILGFLGPDTRTQVLEDSHFTPMNAKYSGRSFPDMYGQLIHANIVSMMLAGSYINEMPFWLLLIIAFVICYIHMFFFIHYYVHRHIWFHIFFKVVQLITSFIIVGISLWLYADFNYKVETGLILIPVILSVDLLYFYDALVKWLHKKYGYKTYYVSAKH